MTVTLTVTMKNNCALCASTTTKEFENVSGDYVLRSTAQAASKQGLYDWLEETLKLYEVKLDDEGKVIMLCYSCNKKFHTIKNVMFSKILNEVYEELKQQLQPRES
uniref:Uncharacterized protein n=1 Tax=viral metagenome TaxID=1070528 RepID=A0A6M3XLH2_9ZZZZ